MRLRKVMDRMVKGEKRSGMSLLDEAGGGVVAKRMLAALELSLP